MLVVSENIKRRILSFIMDFIHREDLRFNDDFPIKVTNAYSSFIEEIAGIPSEQDFIKRASTIKTTFFRLNTRITKRKFLADIAHGLNREFKYIISEIPEREAKEGILPPEPLYRRIYVDEIDSFKKVKRISPKAVENLVPLSVSERKVKESLASIIGEKFVSKDWAGEKSDLYSANVVYNRNRMSTAFLLKGPSVKRLTIDKCGKRGNQVLRLVKEPARLFVVQHNGEIDTDVIEFLETCVSDLSRKKNMKLYYCIMDGVDTARILVAYNKLAES